MFKTLFIIGTRPEAIKIAPLIKEFEKDKTLNFKVCLTGQHREMLDQILSFFSIKADYDLNLMKPNQTLFDITSDALNGFNSILDDYKPDLVIVQGDTTTAFSGALAAFYKKISVAHIEAGLRSHDKYSPYPEEINRKLISSLTDYHFAPTDLALSNLNSEGVKNNVWKVGNTVIDALFLSLDIIEAQDESSYFEFFKGIDFNKRIITATVHRRESYGRPFQDIFNGLKEIALEYEDVEIVFPVHLNPNVRKHAFEILSGVKNVHLIDPLSYPHLIWLMKKSYLILTDSGGIQEEAPSLGKPVLVLRDVTERIEGIEAGTAKLLGTKKEDICNQTRLLLTDNVLYNSMSKAVNPYGDGTTSAQIVSILKKELD